MQKFSALPSEAKMAANHSLRHGLHFYSLQTGACGDQRAFSSKDANYKGRENQEGPSSNSKWTPEPQPRPALWFGNAWLIVINDTHKMHPGSALQAPK